MSSFPYGLRTLVHGPEGGWPADLSPATADVILAAADHIEQLESENERLRVALAMTPSLRRAFEAAR